MNREDSTFITANLGGRVGIEHDENNPIIWPNVASLFINNNY